MRFIQGIAVVMLTVQAGAVSAGSVVVLRLAQIESVVVDIDLGQLHSVPLSEVRDALRQSTKTIVDDALQRAQIARDSQSSSRVRVSVQAEANAGCSSHVALAIETRVMSQGAVAGNALLVPVWEQRELILASRAGLQQEALGVDQKQLDELVAKTLQAREHVASQPQQ